MNFSVFAQLLINGIVAGAPLAVLGLGMSLILNVTRRFHFAYSLTYTLAGFVAAELSFSFGIWPPLAVVVALVVSALAGLFIEVVIYRPLARRAGDDALLPIFVSSLGLTIGGLSAIQLTWGQGSGSVPFTLMDNTPIPLPFGLNTTTLNVTTFVVFSLVAFGGVAVLRYARIGQIVRGVRGNPTMARAVGIKPGTVISWIFIVASAGAGLAACFSATQNAATPDMGYDPLFASFVIAFLAGSRAPALRVVLVGFGLGIVQSVSTIWVPSNLTDIVVFGLLFVYLILKGSGAIRVFSALAGRA